MAWLAERKGSGSRTGISAQYWRPVWQELKGQCESFLAQASSNREPQGRKRDFADAERLVRRHVARELILSFVPDAQQQLWRTMTRSKYQLTRDRVRLHRQIEAQLEQARIKLSSHLSDLLGVNRRRICKRSRPGKRTLHNWPR